MNLVKLIFLMTFFMSGCCHAGCSVTTSVIQKTLNFGNLTVQRDAPVGTSIGSMSLGSTNIIYGTCPGGGYQYEQMVYFGAVSSGVSKVYNTNIAGVGIKGDWGTGYDYTSPPTSQYFSSGTPIDSPPGGSFYLVKTGNITSGALTAGIVAKVTLDGATAIQINLTSTSVTQIACSITTPSLNFPIGDVLTSKFGTNVGTIPTGGQNTQNLGLNCDAGANINVSLSGTQNPDVGTTSVLALTGQGGANVAQGVGVQILYNGTPLTLNNRIVLKQSAGGLETFPLIARYYQTKTVVATGTANASATLNLTYQ